MSIIHLQQNRIRRKVRHIEKRQIFLDSRVLTIQMGEIVLKENMISVISIGRGWHEWWTEEGKTLLPPLDFELTEEEMEQLEQQGFLV